MVLLDWFVGKVSPLTPQEKADLGQASSVLSKRLKAKFAQKINTISQELDKLDLLITELTCDLSSTLNQHELECAKAKQDYLYEMLDNLNLLYTHGDYGAQSAIKDYEDTLQKYHVGHAAELVAIENHYDRLLAKVQSGIDKALRQSGHKTGASLQEASIYLKSMLAQKEHNLKTLDALLQDCANKISELELRAATAVESSEDIQLAISDMLARQQFINAFKETAAIQDTLYDELKAEIKNYHSQILLNEKNSIFEHGLDHIKKKYNERLHPQQQKFNAFVQASSKPDWQPKPEGWFSQFINAVNHWSKKVISTVQASPASELASSNIPQQTSAVKRVYHAVPVEREAATATANQHQTLTSSSVAAAVSHIKKPGA